MVASSWVVKRCALARFTGARRSSAAAARRPSASNVVEALRDLFDGLLSTLQVIRVIPDAQFTHQFPGFALTRLRLGMRDFGRTTSLTAARSGRRTRRRPQGVGGSRCLPGRPLNRPRVGQRSRSRRPAGPGGQGGWGLRTSCDHGRGPANERTRSTSTCRCNAVASSLVPWITATFNPTRAAWGLRQVAADDPPRTAPEEESPTPAPAPPAICGWKVSSSTGSGHLASAARCSSATATSASPGPH